MDRFMQEATDEARAGLAEGGVPVGAVLVRDGEIIGRGRNRFVQHGDPTAHAEMECLRDAGPRGPLGDAVLYTTMSSCIMCSGAMVQLGLGKLVVGDATSYAGAVDFLRENGVEVEIVESEELLALAESFVKEQPDLWNDAASLHVH
jgi:cytosine/creatinine deaminase